MKITYLDKTSHSRRLLLIFLGWGMDPEPFSHLRAPDCDVALAYDFTDESSGDEVVSMGGYDEIMVVAWSFGVIVADRFLASNAQLPVTLRMAVNGTLHPVDDNLGIPDAIFRGTLEGLNEATLLKFQRRMCGGASAAADFLSKAPQRSLESLREELIRISAMQPAHSRWDEAVISRNDRIIPPGNQQEAWRQEKVRVTMIDGPHLPDFTELLSKRIIDKSLVVRRFAKAADTYENHAEVQQGVAARLSELWRKHQVSGHDGPVIEAGAGTGLFTRQYSGWLDTTRLYLWDIAEVNSDLPGTHSVCDAETSIASVADHSVSAVVSASALQWFSSPKGFIHQCARVIKPGGLIVMATYGPDTYNELYAVGYPSIATLCQWVETAGFVLLEAEEQRSVMDFDTPRQLLGHIRLTGVNARSASPETVGQARSILRSGLTRLTYHTILLVARRRDDS